jgi:transcriptional regulator with XRE-family HTH domain
VPKPEGGHFSPGYISRIERGWATATLYAYLAIAAALDVDPGRLLGPDAAATDIGEDEAILLRCVSELGIEPHQAVLRLVRG